jgi:hypothetical protein
VVPLRLGGLRGKKSTPSAWLGGTSELSLVGKPKRHGAKEAAQRGTSPKWACGQGMILMGKVESVLYSANYCYW